MNIVGREKELAQFLKNIDAKQKIDNPEKWKKEHDYNTPMMDKLMIGAGWEKVNKEAPVFIKSNEGYNAEVYPYIVVFPTDYWGHYKMYEEWLEQGKLTESDVRKFIHNIEASGMCKTFVSEKNKKTGIARLTGDFYYHNQEPEKAKIYEKKII